jgi:predicted DNA-binding transcriptional regulator AlpA
MNIAEKDAIGIYEFCDRHGISRSSWYNLIKSGQAPRVMRVGAPNSDFAGSGGGLAPGTRAGHAKRGRPRRRSAQQGSRHRGLTRQKKTPRLEPGRLEAEIR